MDFEQISRSLLPLLGGKENIASAAHCATRLRLVLVDDALADQQAIGKIDGVKGCFRNAGQMQIIFGTGVVNKVYAAFIQAAGISESSKSEAADLAAKKLNPFQRIARLHHLQVRTDRSPALGGLRVTVRWQHSSDSPKAKMLLF